MFYRIISNPYGFTSNFNFALSQLWAFDSVERSRDDGRSDTAVVDWTDPNWFYAEQEPVHGTTNVWEYYFHQPMGVSVGEIKGGVMDGLPEYDLRHDKYAERQSCLPEIRALIKKYIKPKEHLQKIVSDFWWRTQLHSRKSNVLGVHYRDTDMPAIHGQHVKLETAFEKILNLRDKFDSVVLATECQTALNRFTEWAKENNIRLFHTDCFRVAPGVVSEFMSRTDIQGHPESFVSTVARQLHIHEYEINTNPRPLHHYKLGLEVMTDVLLLSKCDYFLHGYSGVSNLATFFSEAPVENIFTYS